MERTKERKARAKERAPKVRTKASSMARAKERARAEKVIRIGAESVVKVAIGEMNAPIEAPPW